MDLNHATLTDTLARDPITRFADHGTLQAGLPGVREGALCLSARSRRAA
jgi:hypothetical protein